MIGIIVTVLVAMILLGALSVTAELHRGTPFAKLLMGGFGVRLVLQYFVRDIPFFSHGAGGDSIGYEQLALILSAIWDRSGIHFVTAKELPMLGPTSLPPNLFALLVYANGGEATRLGCTAIVALAAALTALNIHALSVELGAEKRNALLFSILIYFQPAFLFYTCDTYKDGLVLCLAIGGLGSALRLAKRFSVIHALIGIACLWALWYVRFYLIFVTIAPLLVGTIGLGRKSMTRPILAALTLAAIAFALAAFTDVLQMASDRASQAFEAGTSDAVIKSNAQGGSGVEFDDGGKPYGALLSKMAYTLFAPFPWAGGSIGFQIGKLDVF
jgi:hypothetical protein